MGRTKRSFAWKCPPRSDHHDPPGPIIILEPRVRFRNAYTYIVHTHSVLFSSELTTTEVPVTGSILLSSVVSFRYNTYTFYHVYKYYTYGIPHARYVPVRYGTFARAPKHDNKYYYRLKHYISHGNISVRFFRFVIVNRSPPESWSCHFCTLGPTTRVFAW